ncbi:Asp23/Gls24 family envelope stress response protein [Streptococcus ferus]|uniref:Stress response regulator gls24 homolog n=1 Tax=Streptococcus ferus TaxID=1345 RepID=A0A2X3VVC0_9STRE|nr:Asp23/Gls24 family envelope stress response protein [Streptococcus ferus]SQF39189.1 General stress protein, Gls24 family [Streptococcus ferus]
MTDTIKSEVTYSDGVIAKIVGYALQNVDGLLAVSGSFFSNIKDKLVNSENVKTGVKVEVGQEEVAIDLDIIVEYGKDIPAIVESIKAIADQNVEVMTHLKVVELNVNVVDVKTKAEHETDSVTVQDRLTDAAQATSEFVGEKAGQAKDAVAAGTEKVKEATINGTEAVEEKLEESRVN